MKLELEVLDDQLDLLKRIQALPEMIDKFVGEFPAAFPGHDPLGGIRDHCATLEFDCKKMIFETTIFNTKLNNVFDNMKLVPGDYPDWYND